MPHDHDERGEDARAIHGLTHILADWLAESRAQFHWMATHHHFATKTDIENLNSEISMKLNEVKTIVAQAKAQQREALAEIGTQLADLNAQIAALVAAATDPEVTDEVFLADLNDLKTDAQAPR